MQMAALTLKLSENNDKIDDLLKADKDIKKDITDNSNSIKNFYTKQDVNNIISQYYLKKYLYDKTYIDTNFLVKSEIDKKDNEILNKVNNNFYSRNYINDNYHLKNNIYDKNYINNVTNNLYNRTYLDNKFDNIYDKTEVNKTSKLDRNIVLFNTNLTKFIDETYKKDQKLLDDKISTLENKNLTETQSNKLEQLENIDFANITTTYNYSVYNKAKLDKFSHYIKEFFMHNIDLVRRFEITSEVDYIQILQFEIDRNFLVNDVIKFFISIKLLYENMSKVYWTLYFKMDVHYKDDVIIKSFKKQMTSKGFLFKNLATYNIDNMFKLNKDTDRLIFKLYMYKLSTAYKNNVIVTLTNSLEENYCNLIWYRNQ